MTRLSTEERDNLVAYLDGELDERATKQIEQKLSQSQVARHDVELLSRTWDLLDVLPRVQVSGEFTQKTLSLARLESAPSKFNADAWARALRRAAILAGWGAGIALSALIGFKSTREWMPNPAELLLQDLPVIENLDVYSEVDSLGFLIELRKARTFQDETEPSEPAQ